ncbi:hypothetical protein DOM21_13325 [Bacteriovorax stolpii]|uniref:hypothetical protein n=1 Tax=Bacteriovorax stolpii TaxID=960 RepID=UPI001157ACD2|nr:hypothetical protein [Bacteriovorax stolpii]QDK42408.1 hypothetical protein DOM21_13325 [Bacteriovorax stolpii]
MEKLKQLLNHLVIALCLAVTSCGYVSDKPVENVDVYKTDELQTCKIDVSKLGEIFKADQKEQIKCLQENFIQFTKYVRAKHPGTVTEAELGIFVKRFFEGQSDSIIKGLSLIFQLNMLLLKDEADRISHTNISPLFELLVQVNQEAVVLTNIIKTMDEDKNQLKFWELRQRFKESTERFAAAAVGVIDKSPGMAKKLNMREFILDMSKKIGDGQIDNESIDSFIFLKKVIVGGDEEVITTDELKDLITKLPRIMGLIFDVYYCKSENFKSEADEMRFYLLTVRNLYHSIKFNQDDFELLNSEQVVKLAEKLLKNYDVESFKPSIEALKARFIGGKPDSITLKDLDTVLIMVHDFFEKVYFNHVTYDDAVNNHILSKPGPVDPKEFKFKQLPEYDVFTNKPRLEQLYTSFADIVFNFRYFRDSTGTAFYDTQILRNKSGFIEVNIAKWLSWKLLKAYGHTDANKQMQLSMDEFSKFLLDAKPLLQEFKLWSPNFQTFSRNAVLLADLFQQQSNGDQAININEATEYIGMLLTAVEVSGKHSENLTGLCDPGINAEDPVFETSCFNENFYDLVLNKLGYKKSLPRLANYYATASKKETMDYLKGVEGFARDNNAPGVPVNRRDTTLVIGAMLNIETTFIRFDKNSDNIIDYKELSEAFFTYRASIITLAGLKPEQEKYAKGVFLYMASKMEVPKTGTWMTDAQFGIFNSCVQSDFCRDTFMDKIEAKRLNIGKLLYYMVNQASPAAVKK